MKAKRVVQQGFNLMELIVVIAIIGILVNIAYPAYTQYITETRRSDGWIALNSAAADQQHWYAVNFSYTDELGNLGGADSFEGFYTISVVADATSFTLTATAKNTSVQINDTGCTVLTLNSTGVQTPAACW